MKLKLNHSQFFALYDLLQHMIMAARPSGIETRLLHSILISVYKKFYNKAFIRNKKEYKINLTDEEACAWYLFFSKCEIPNNMLFEQTTILMINNSIHQKFAA